MKKKNQSEIVKERFTKSVNMEQKISEPIETMLINDIERVLKSYFVYQKNSFRTQFTEDDANKEFNLTLQYQRVKDIKVL